MPLSWNEIKSRALTFSRTWADAANEDSQGKPFWIDFFEIFGITDKRVATFEHAVKKLLGEKARVDGFVDLFWPGMLLVEQKSRGKNLDAALTQALSYFPGIAERDLPQLIIVCDFARFRVHRLTTGETIEFALKDLHKNIRIFGFIAGYKALEIKPQDPVNIKAAERMGRLHDALKASGYTGHPLEVLLVRLLFCLFADDTGIFQPAQSFRTFIEERTATDGSDLGSRLAQLFQVLNTEESKRSKALDEQVAAFPYVNGKLFAESLPMADFTSAMREALLDACALDWSAISPAIFGSLFQSIMDEKARRNLGAHYTSEENILKLIKPLFLDGLWAEFEKVKSNKNRLFEFHKKLRTLTFFDPACGCGNFLVISYRELRALELAVLRASNTEGQLTVDVHQLIGINVDQFYGIEIEEFPAQIAQVALWLMDHQMNLRVSEEFGLYFARIPLRTTPHIVHGNALRLDWNEVLPAERCSYVLGNPPFVGHHYQSAEQKADQALVMTSIQAHGVLDFVANWYVKAADYIRGVAPASAWQMPGAHTLRSLKSPPTSTPHSPPGVEFPSQANVSPTRIAFVSTNSITQGEQVGVLWGWLLAQGLHIQFAHRTFSWNNEARGKAAVHCVIIGFGLEDLPGKVIYEYDDIKGEPHAVPAANINPYLVDAPDLVLPNRSEPISTVPPMRWGNKPTDGGHLLFTAEELRAFLQTEPQAKKFIRPFISGGDFIDGVERYCLWLVDASPSELRGLPRVLERVEAVRRFRSESKASSTQAYAAHPTRFRQISQPKTAYLAVPEVSSERREYIPMAFVLPEVICSNTLQFVSDATPFHFGVMTSRMHMAWVSCTCGRMKSDYRYSNSIVYNNFPWPEFAQSHKPNQALALVDKAQVAIETAAQAVLDVRAQFQSGDQPATLADLYDPLTMPPELLKAHQKLDAAVDKAYEASGGKKSYKSDAERVAFLFELYQKYTSLLPATPVKGKRKMKPA
ncbi:MAG: class I SAM-dependent DNA methyltransferase [Aquabacterium sp.]|nr:class I SAM-dependent DNA methyltransferase [Aquabacterium sp.]